MGMQNAVATLEDNLVVSFKTKHTLSIWSSNHTPWHLHKGDKNLCPKTCTQMFQAAVFRIGSNQDVLQQMDYTNNYGIFWQWDIICAKRKWAIKLAKTWRKPKCLILGKKLIWKGYMLHDSNYVKFWKRQDYGNNKNVSCCWQLG